MKARRRFRKVIIAIAIFILAASALFFQKIRPEKLSVREVLESFSSKQLRKVVFEVDESSVVFDPWLNGFPYRRAITINNTANTNNLTDYQVLVTLDTATLISAGKMQSYCNDTRFTDSDGVTQLNYWLESGCNSANTKLWVKVPSIPSGSTKTIYLYYGNSEASSASSGSNTFIFFDDFSTNPSTRYDFYVWYQSPTWSWDSTNKWIVIKTYTTYGALGVFHKTLNLRNMVLEIDLYSAKGLNSWIGLLARYTDPTTETGGLRGVYNYYEQQLEIRGTGIADVSMSAPPRGNWYKLVWKMAETSHVLQFWNGSTLLGQNSGTQTTTVNTGRVGFGAYYEDIYYDNFRVRQYTPPEPTTSLGAEDVLITQAGSPTLWQWKVPAQGEKIRSGSATSWAWKAFTNDGTGVTIPRGSAINWQWGP